MKNTRNHLPGKKSTNTAKEAVRKVCLVSLTVNVSISAIKIAGGILGSSRAVTADGFHSLSDCITDIVLLIGVKYWSQPPDYNHPFGHKKIETILSVAVGLLVAGTAVGLGASAILGLNAGVHSAPGTIALIAALISIFSKELLFHYTRKRSRKIKSNALEANAWHHRSDAFSSFPAVIAVTVAWIFPEIGFVDNIGAIVVSVLIGHAAWKIIRPNLGQLAEEAASNDTVEMIRKTAIATYGIKDVHAIRTRVVGNSVFVDLHVLVEQHLTIREGHEIATAAQRNLKNSIEEIEDVLVHVEPFNQ